MIDDPERWAPGYAEAGAYNVTFHAEACDDPVALAKDLRAAGAQAGLAIDRDTPVEPYLELLPHFDTLLIMTIKAGFGGQEFMPEMLDKVRVARRHATVGPPGAAHRGRRRDRRGHHRGGGRGGRGRVRRRHRRLRRRRSGGGLP